MATDDNGLIAQVFVTRAIPGNALERLGALHEIDVWADPLPPTPAELRERVSAAEGLLCTLSDRVDAAMIAAAPSLRAIANYAAGSDNVDLVAAGSRGIQVGVTPDVLTDATADLTFALLLAAARRLPEAIDAVNSGTWHTWEPAGWLGADVHRASLGIIGFGRIGRAVARRARGFEMTVRSTADTPLQELLAESDFVSLHCPLTAATRHLIDATALAHMRSTAVLVNTARGGVIDQVALARALHAGTIAGAALDVTDPEPLPPDDALFAAPNLLVLPHIGSATRTARSKMASLAVENLLAGLAGSAMAHPAR